MRYRIYFDDPDQDPVEIDCRVIVKDGNKKIKAYEDTTNYPLGHVTVAFGNAITKVVDNHGREVVFKNRTIKDEDGCPTIKIIEG